MVDAKFQSKQAHFNELRALRLIDQGKLIEAEMVYKKLISEGTSNHVTYGNLAAVYGLLGRYEEMKEYLVRALDICPEFADGHKNLGTLYQKQGNYFDAIQAYARALKIKPNHYDACFNMGVCFKNLGNFDNAIKCYLNTLKIKPDYFDAQNNLGNIYLSKGEIDSAINHYQKALNIKPNFSAAHNNLANALKEKGDLKAAISHYKISLEMNPDCPDINWNFAQALLLFGNYRDGWERYIRRDKRKGSAIPDWMPNGKEWNGTQLNQGEELLLVSDQGLGDTLQFMRYILVLKRQGIEVSFCAQKKLHSLVQASGIHSSPLSQSEVNGISSQKWVRLLSLPKHLEVNPDNPIITDPYISSSPELVRKWRKILSVEKRPIIALNWQGNLDVEKKYLPGRSLPLETFSIIAKQCDVRFVSLQKGYGSSQLATCSFRDRFVGCQDMIDQTLDFLEIAAIVANSDLVISSDTCTAHLAGGMGMKTWLLLQAVPEWRWGLDSERTFWYPSMRIFRQKEKGDWLELMRRVSKEIKSSFSLNEC